MALYTQIVLALELSDDAEEAQIIKKARALVEKTGAQLTLVHVVEHLVSFGAAYSMPAGVEIEEELQHAAQQRMADIANTLNVPSSHQIVKAGTAKQVIVDEAKHVGADLIILGSHGRHGVRLLLGSTANAVLHAAECDVLAVRVQ